MCDRQQTVRRQLWAWGAICVACLSGAGTPVEGASGNRVELKPTPAEVNTAMKKAVDYLLSQKNGDNFETWKQAFAAEQTAPNTGGETALVMYALLHTGQSVNDPRLTPTSPTLAPVMEYLGKLHPDGTYVAGLSALAIAFSPPGDENRRRIGPAAQYLMHAVNRDPTQARRNGGFGYHAPIKNQLEPGIVEAMLKQSISVDPNSDIVKNLRARLDNYKKWPPGPGVDWGFPDGSNSQYGVLGMWAIEGFGLDVPRGVWLAMDGFWRCCQTSDGDFEYYQDNDKDRRKSITAAGVASLYITTEKLDTDLRLEPREDKAINLGLDKLVRDFDPSGYDLYYTYGLARVGLASGKKFFGTRNWYRETAANIVLHQHPDGSFDFGAWGGQYNPKNMLGTSYALLFLARGQNAVPFNKLEYNGPWNARRTDDANIVDWLGKQYEKEFNWQSVNLQVPPEEWLDAPVLLITGSKALNFSADEQAKIKRYIEMGGLVFSTSDGGSGEFDNSVRQLMRKLFPAYSARPLLKDDVLFSGDLGAEAIKSTPSVVAVSNGVRDLWVHTPEDMGGSWFKHAYAKSSHFVFPRNLYFYSVSLNLARTRLDDIVVRPGNAALTSKASVAKVKLGASQDLEPFAWERMQLIAKADLLMDLTVTSNTLAEIVGSKPPLAVLTGNDTFAASGGETSALQDYLNNGGTLFADAAGGSKAFANSFLGLVRTALPGSTMETIPPDDELYTGKTSGAPTIGEVQFRRYSRHIHGSSLGKLPKLRGVRVGKRWAVIFSEYDVTSGLLGTETWGIDGYSPDSAVAIVRNVLKYAQQPHPAK